MRRGQVVSSSLYADISSMFGLVHDLLCKRKGFHQHARLTFTEFMLYANLQWFAFSIKAIFYS